MSSLVAWMVKKPPEMWETRVRPLGWEDLLEKGMIIHFSILPGELNDRGAWWAIALAKSQT